MPDNQRVMLTKRLLREGLLRLLETKPIDKITVTELCKESGINRATFYRHYELPRDVLYEIESELIQGIGERMPTGDSAESVEQAVENVLCYFYERADLLKVLYQCKTGDNFNHALNEFYTILMEKKGTMRVIRDLDDESTKLLSNFIVGGVTFLLQQWLQEEIDKTPKEIAQLILRFLDIEAMF